MKTFTSLFLICLLVTAGYACTKPKPKPKPEPPKCTQTQTQRQTQSQSLRNVNENRSVSSATGVGLGLGIGIGKGGAGGAGGNASALGGNASVSIDMGGVSDATSQGGISSGYGSVWLDEVWRPNAMVTPWNPQVIPSIPVEPVQAPQDSTTPERTLGFLVDGLQFVLED